MDDEVRKRTLSLVGLRSFTGVPMSDFTSRVLSVVRRIPPGRVATYGDVAEAAGRPRAWRAVGNIMSGCARRDVPCHRVIAAAGRLGGYGGNVEMKRALLRAEGITVTASTIRDFRARRWTPGSTPPRTKRAAGAPDSTPPRTKRAAGVPGGKSAARRT
jgi:O-6-methylguanine DNA methyltransferase